jgi:hypothetical protein
MRRQVFTALAAPGANWGSNSILVMSVKTGCANPLCLSFASSTPRTVLVSNPVPSDEPGCPIPRIAREARWAQPPHAAFLDESRTRYYQWRRVRAIRVSRSFFARCGIPQTYTFLSPSHPCPNYLLSSSLFGQHLLKTNRPSGCVDTSPEGTAESSPARSAGYAFPTRPVPQGRLKITQDVSPGCSINQRVRSAVSREFRQRLKRATPPTPASRPRAFPLRCSRPLSSDRRFLHKP